MGKALQGGGGGGSEYSCRTVSIQRSPIARLPSYVEWKKLVMVEWEWGTMERGIEENLWERSIENPPVEVSPTTAGGAIGEIMSSGTPMTCMHVCIYTLHAPELSNGTPFPVVLDAVNHEGKRSVGASMCNSMCVDVGERRSCRVIDFLANQYDRGAILWTNGKPSCLIELKMVEVSLQWTINSNPECNFERSICTEI